MSKRVTNAEDLFEDFHEKEPRNYDILKVPMPDTVFFDGVADDIVYRSGKWQPGNKKQDYIHKFDSFPPVFFEGGEGRARAVSGLIGDLDKQIPLTLLGTCLEFRYRVGDKKGELVEWFFSKPPKLLSTPDRKTLVILTEEGPIFVSGAKMRVEARGIVQ
jgi:hypothetical protein